MFDDEKNIPPSWMRVSFGRRLRNSPSSRYRPGRL
jgi:hypothetical protein